MYKTIIWDWNGTLLDDLQLSVDSVNILLQERKLPPLSVDRYKDIFCFPVVDYYKKAGFDFENEPFEIPARQYVKLYYGNVDKTRLSRNAIDTLSFIKENGFRQIILSAMEQNNLKKMTESAGISHYFDGIFGIKDNYAREKVSLGKDVIKELELNPSECLMVGDTLHDAEVAEQCGFDCILYSGGHVSRQRLESKKFRIIDNLIDLTHLYKR